MTDVASSDVRAMLADRAFIFDDPDAYMAGVDDALRARHTPSATIGSRADDASPATRLLDGRGQE